MKKDMTEGSPFRLLTMFTIPLLLGNLLQQTYNVTDAMIVGRFLGAQALASVGGTSSIQFLVLGFCIGNCAGFGIPVAKHFGAGNEREMKRRVVHSLYLTGFLAAAMTALCALLIPLILRFLNTPDEIFKDAYRYLLIIFLGLPCTLLYNCMASILRSLGDSRTPFVYLCISAVLNIVLDCFCIIVLKSGVVGAALATILSQGISGLLCTLRILRKTQIFAFRKDETHFSLQIAREMMNMGIPLGLQSSITAAGMMVMQSANNSLGSVYISGLTAGMKIKQFALCPFDALATAITVYCSQNLGAGKIRRIRTGILHGLTEGVLYGLGCGLLLILFGRNLASLFISTENTQILDIAGRYLRSQGQWMFVLGILTATRPAVQGLGYAGVAIFAGIAEMFGRVFISRGLLSSLGFGAICIADPTAWICASVLMSIALVIIYRKLRKRYGQ